jgi:hypothetical protein
MRFDAGRNLEAIVWTAHRNERNQIVLTDAPTYPAPGKYVIATIPDAPTNPPAPTADTPPTVTVDVRHSTDGTTWTDLITFAE